MFNPDVPPSEPLLDASASQADRPVSEGPGEKPPSPPSPPPAWPLRAVFIGPNGIRAGWRLLLFLGIAWIAEVGFARIIRIARYRYPSGFSPTFLILGEGSIFLAVLVAAA